MFDQLLMQAATNSSFATSSSDLIASVALILTPILSIVVFIANKFLTGKAKKIALDAAQIGMVGVQKATEAKERIATGLDAFYQLSPEDAKKELDKTLPILANLKKEVDMGTQQITRIAEMNPEYQAKNLAIPREDFETKPTFKVTRRTTVGQ